MSNRILAGRYELLEKIGEGGMAVVYKGRDRLLNRNVAVKILKPEFTEDRMFIESFRRESQTAAGLVHPNIVNVYDVGKEGSIYYIIMEFINGKALSQIIKEEGALDPRKAVAVTKQVASALSMAHKHHLIHRDVKPHNILITEDGGDAKITDFGIAKAITKDTLVGPQKEAVLGSVHYFSPEQARGGYVDEKSDIYSLGIVLYEMLTGKAPFDGESAVEVAVKHMNEEMVPPSELNPSIPSDLDEIVLKATNKIQVNRYKDADDLITALNFVKYSKSTGVSSAASIREGEFGRANGEYSNGENNSESPDGRGNKDSTISENAKEQAPGRSRKTKKKIVLHPKRAIAAVLAVLLAFPVSSFLFERIKEATKREELRVPKVEGLTLEEATAALEPFGLNIEVEMELNSDIYGPGEIMSQRPKEGVAVREGQTIRVNISKGGVETAVPDVEGKPLSGAKHILETYGYSSGAVTEVHDEQIPKGIVISQNPKGGSSLEAGGRVSLTVSLGAKFEPFEMPNLVGKTLEEARSILSGLGITEEEIKYEENATVDPDTVLAHLPVAKKEIEEAISVTLTVSKLPEKEPSSDPETPTDPPDQIGNAVSIRIDFSKAKEETFLMSVTVSDGIYEPRTIISKEERSKSAGSEMVSVSGAGRNGMVIVSFDNDIVYQYEVDFISGKVI